MKYRKKPIVVEAVQWLKHGDHHAITTVPLSYENGLFIALESGIPLQFYGWLQTLEGSHMVAPGDWIITDANGSIYPCKPDKFELIYEAEETPVVTNAINDITIDDVRSVGGLVFRDGDLFFTNIKMMNKVIQAKAVGIEDVINAGGTVHSDGNIFFASLEMMGNAISKVTKSNDAT